MVTAELTEKESMDIRAVARKYGADEGLVAAIYLGIRAKSLPEIAASPFGFPLILTGRRLQELGYRRQNGYKPI